MVDISCTSLTVIAGAAVIVNFASQVTGSQPFEVAVNITVFEPPHKAGAPVLLFESVPLVAVAEANHVANAASTAA